MGKVTGFLEIDRQELKYQPAADRIRHFKEFTLPLSEPEIERQAARCMDCGIPFCQSDAGCPVDNQIPDWNDLVYAKDWEEASRNLHSTNNFPEFTGRVCPAPCEEACTLNIENTPVAIKAIEQAIADRAWAEGWIAPQPPQRLTGKTVGIVGAGSAGMAAAQQLARVGHEVHLYERYAKSGGLLRYGIPDFKMEKVGIDRRQAQLEAEGVRFHFGADIGAEGLRDLLARHDAVLLTTGAERFRDPGLPGVEMAGVHYAMPFLVQQNRRVGREPFADAPIVASGKHVVVIGGGDTASDCIGTSIRQGALSVTQLDIRPMPPIRENKDVVWPYWPTKFRTSSSQAEGADREFAVATLEITGRNGRATHVRCARVDPARRPIPGTEFDIRAELVLIAIGFSGPMLGTYLDGASIELDSRTNVKANTDDYRTSVPKVYAAGDVRRGQSLVVWAIREGRQAARAIDLDLMGETTLPR